jgi:hypothetical protein
MHTEWLAVVGHACNSTYGGGRDGTITVLGHPEKVNKTLSQK